MRTLLMMLPYAVIGVCVGKGPYGVMDWEWWAMDAAIILSIAVKDFAARSEP